MILRGVAWGWNRFRPEEGWLAFFLLGGATACLIFAVLEAEWVAEDWVVGPTAVSGFFLSVLLAKRPLRPLPAWILIALYGLFISFINLAQLWPTIAALSGHTISQTEQWRQNAALFADRFGSWLKAAFSDGSSQETIVFAFGLGLLAWFLAAYAGWSSFRQHKPLLGLTVMGVAITINGYFGNTAVYWIGLFMAMTALITAVIHYANLEQGWIRNGVDYSEQVKIDLTLYAGVIAIFLLTLAMTLPGLQYRELAQLFRSQPLVQSAEETLGRVFAGVQQPQRAPSPGGVGGSGLMPRAYLLGNPPDLSERVMMTAVVNVVDKSGNETLAPPALLRGNHWRALSYDVYTGRGWALSEERKEPIAANQPLPLPPIIEQTTLSTSLNWVWDERVIRYTLGLPQQFDQEVTVSWRGLEDLSRVQGKEGTIYQVKTRLPKVSADVLRKTAVSAIPATTLARYTNLPVSVPQRVHDLAHEVAAGLDNPYDQARALEQFLRQYPYSLDVELPPSNVDPVAFFLCDLQAGYCDYYASSMVVMARSLGLPARMAVGFLSQPPNEAGEQTIRQINAHSWAEIYFAGYGWVEFEPTAPFPSPQDAATGLDNGTTLDEAEPAYPEDAVPTIPEVAPIRQIPWGRLALLLLILPVAWVWQRRQKQINEQGVLMWRYGRLQQHSHYLGHTPHRSETPREFKTAFQSQLHHIVRQPWLTKWVNKTDAPIERLTILVEEQQYGEKKDGTETAVIRQLWRQLNRPLWLLRLIKAILRL